MFTRIFIGVAVSLLVAACTNRKVEEEKKQLESKVTELQTQVEQLQRDLEEQKKQSSTVQNPSLSQSQSASPSQAKTQCLDSDGKNINIKGYVLITSANGTQRTIYDECTGTGQQVREPWCYEQPQGSGNWVDGLQIYDCPNGCVDGACR